MTNFKGTRTSSRGGAAHNDSAPIGGGHGAIRPESGAQLLRMTTTHLPHPTP